jgi:hypothetical protein
MKIRITKTGSYAIHHAVGPIVELVDGQEITDICPFTIDFINTMVNVHKCAVRVKEFDEETVRVADFEKEFDEEIVRKTIQSIIELSKNKKEAKVNLEIWSKDLYGVGIEHTKKIGEIIEYLVKVARDAR